MLRIGLLTSALVVNVATGFWTCGGAWSFIRKVHFLGEPYVHVVPNIFIVFCALFLLSMLLTCLGAARSDGWQRVLILVTGGIVLASSAVIFAYVGSGVAAID